LLRRGTRIVSAPDSTAVRRRWAGAHSMRRTEEDEVCNLIERKGP
jgi:hypothetical protein